LIWIIKNNIKI